MKMNFKLQGAKLRYLREFRQLSQSELARKLKVKPQFICNIERGAAGIPPKYIEKLSDTLGFPIVTIVGAMVVDYSDFLFSFCKPKGTSNGHSKTNKK